LRNSRIALRASSSERIAQVFCDSSEAATDKKRASADLDITTSA
jgi:hypothetical protein